MLLANKTRAWSISIFASCNVISRYNEDYIIGLSLIIITSFHAHFISA